MNACVEVSAQNHAGREALDFAIAREQSDCEVLHQRKLRVRRLSEQWSRIILRSKWRNQMQTRH